MKTILRFFALFAIAALFRPATSPAAGNYTLGWGGDPATGQITDIPDEVVSNATQIASAPGGYHNLALVGGRVYGWGVSENGGLDFPLIQNAVFIAAGENSGIAVNSEGAVRFWGAKHNATFRDGCTNDSLHCVSAALGSDHGLLLTDAGKVWAWGAPESTVPVSTPNAEWESGFTAVAAGRNFSMGLSNGVVHVAAPTNDDYKILDIPAAATDVNPRTRSGSVTAIAAGPYHAMALTTNGEVLVWGAWCEEEEETAAASSKALLPRNSFGNVTNVPPEATSGIVAIAAGYNVCAALTTNRGVVVWGSAEGSGSVLADIPAFAGRDVREIVLGRQHVLVRSTWLPPEFNGTDLPEAHLESEYTASIPVMADPAATIAVVDERFLPAGISLGADGVFSGVPTATNVPVTNTFKVVAANIYGSVTQEFSIAVFPRLPVTPEWQTTALPSAVVGFPYSFQLEATEDPTFTADQNLPSWVSLSSSGLLAGTPTDADVGSAYPTFTAANEAGSTNRDLTLTVVAQSADTPPVIGLESIPDLLVGTHSVIDLQIVGATTVSLSGDLADAGFRASSSNGVWLLSGTPTVSVQGTGKSAVVVAANTAASATKTYSVDVQGPPVWKTSVLPSATIGQAYSATLVADFATDYVAGDAATLRAIPLALSVTNDGSQVVAILSGTPTNAVSSSFSIPVTARNAYGNPSCPFTLTLSATPADPPDYRFLSITPSLSGTSPAVTLVWTNLTDPDTSAVLLCTTNLLSWPADGDSVSSPATIPVTDLSVPAFYGLAAP